MQFLKFTKMRNSLLLWSELRYKNSVWGNVFCFHSITFSNCLAALTLRVAYLGRWGWREFIRCNLFKLEYSRPKRCWLVRRAWPVRHTWRSYSGVRQRECGAKDNISPEKHQLTEPAKKKTRVPHSCTSKTCQDDMFPISYPPALSKHVRSLQTNKTKTKKIVLYTKDACPEPLHKYF